MAGLPTTDKEKVFCERAVNPVLLQDVKKNGKIVKGCKK